MIITFLGTGGSTGVPLIGCNCKVCKSSNFKDKRLRSSIMIETQGKCLIIDTSPDFRYQMLRENINHIDAVLYTHYHLDHTSGIDDLRAYNILQKESMNLYANQETADALHKRYPFYFNNPKKEFPNILKSKFHIIDSKHSIHIQDIKIQAIAVKHFNIEVFGYRINNLTYITDVSQIPPSEIPKIKGSKVLILSALRQTPHHSHFSLGQATQIAKIINVPNTYFTHMSHQMGLHNEINTTLPHNIQLAHDGLKITIDK